MALGHFMMAFEPLFYFALATIAIGNGLFLPSLAKPDQRSYYRPNDHAPRHGLQHLLCRHKPRRIPRAPFVCGTIGELYGWHWGFMLAGVGMAIGLVTSI